MFSKLGLLVVNLIVVLVLVSASTQTQAVPTYDPQDPIGDDLSCLPEVILTGDPLMVGFPLVGPIPCARTRNITLFDIGDLCSGYRVALKPGEFEWEFLLPAASGGVVQDSDTLSPKVLLDSAGGYIARFYACPNGCSFVSTDSTGIPITVEVEPQPVRIVSFETVPALPPETRPVLPDSALAWTERRRSTKAERKIKCDYGGGVLDPQWVTVDEFNGPLDYAGGDLQSGQIQMVEGVVHKSKVSRKDSILNHWHQDHNFGLKPDPVHNYVLPIFDDGEGSQNFLEMEWETGSFDANFRPGNGDRVSAFGYLIYDCGHPPFKIEIHPPVGLAVHRNRAIRIPDNPQPENIVDWAGGPVGQNIYVPGIHTEVFFNPNAGKMMAGSNGTQLHQPGTELSDPTNSSDGVTPVENGDAIKDPSPIAGEVYTFNIYLPRNPKSTLEAVGVTGLPDIPLYYKVTNLGSEQLPLEVVPVTEGDVTYLRATMDFSGYDSEISGRLSAQVEAAWVYPSLSPDNWGLKRWRVQLDSLLVHDDSDGKYRGEGEWNLWFHVNNALPGSAQHEWTKIISQKISDHTYVMSPTNQLELVKPLLHDFQGSPWSTGDDINADRWLGPDLLLFPDQGIQIHTSGFEGDTLSSDSLALIDAGQAQVAGAFSRDNTCKDSDDLDSLVYSGCAKYELDYQILAWGSPTGSALSPAAQTLMDAYNFGEDGGCPPDGDDVCGPVIIQGQLAQPIQEDPWHPDMLILNPGDAPVSAFDTSLFKPQGIEEFALTEISFANFDKLIRTNMESDPDAVHQLLTEIREDIDEKLVTVGPEVLLDVQVICASLPTRLCKIYFGDLPPPEMPADTSYRRFTGAGKVGGKGGSSFTFSMHCEFLRQPNQFDLRWGGKSGHRFKMDLMTMSSCEQAPEPLLSHQGWALGSLDGVPGAMVNWTITDGGEPSGQDTVDIKVYNAENSVIHEVSGQITGANIKAHER